MFIECRRAEFVHSVRSAMFADSEKRAPSVRNQTWHCYVNVKRSHATCEQGF